MAREQTPEDALIAEFVSAQDGAVIEIADQGLVSLARLVETGSIDVSPRFQRRDRWGSDKQALLIESFLANIPVPPVYLAEDQGKLGSYAVIDGKQRLTAISDFLNDRLQLKGLTRLPSFNGLRHADMPLAIQNSLGMKSLRITTLLRQSSDELKHEVFLRLNTGGEILNAQEIRNVAYHGPLNDLIYELAENHFLRSQFKVRPKSSPAYRKMTDAEMVLRFFALSAGWHSFAGGLRLELDRFMWTNRLPEEQRLTELRRSFERCIDTAGRVWGDQAFKRPGRDQSIAGLYDAQMIALHELSDASHERLVANAKKVANASNGLFDDPDFEDAVRTATNTPSKLRHRTNVMLDSLRSHAG